MTPNFALSLTFEGIRLLHRVQDGWHMVGEVALDVDDLGAALAQLRAQALTIEPGGLRTKLLIPNEQIKYLALDSTRVEMDDVLAALDGATPYAVADLAVDFTKGGGRTYVAAVARETLDEAASFATEHNFEPVCFAAVPEAFTFVGEAFFGALDGFDVQRDEDPVVVIGVADVGAAKPDPAPDAIAEPEEVAAPEPEKVAAPDPAPDATPDAAADTAPPTKPAPDIAPSDPSDMFEELTLAASAPDDTADIDLADETPAPAGEPVFAARPRAPLAAPASDAPTPKAPPVFAPARAAKPANETRMDPPPLAVPQGKNTSPMPALAGVKVGDRNGVAAPVTPLRAETPDPADAPAVTGVAQTAVPDAEVQHFEAIVPTHTPAQAPEETPEPAPLAAPARAPDTDIPDKPGLFRSRRKERAEKPQTAPAAAQSDELSQMTVFGARKPAKAKSTTVVGGKPRFLGLILTAVLLLFLIAVAAFAAIISEDGLAGWFNRGTVETAATDPVAQPATPPDIDPVSGVAALDDGTALGQGGTDDAVTPDAPDFALMGEVLSPAEAQRIYAATGVWQRAPRSPQTPRTDVIGALTVAATQPITRQQTPEIPDFSMAARDGSMLAPVNPPPPGTDFPRDERGLVLATPEGTLTPDGIVLIAGSPSVLPPVRPGTIAPQVAAAPETRPETTPQAAPAFVSAAPSEVTLRPRLRPQSDAAVAPEATPDTAPETALESEPDAAPGAVTEEPAPAGGIALTALRPLPRPGGLAPVAAPVPEPDPRLSGFRPRLRPDGLVPAAAPEPEPEVEPAIPTAAEPPTLQIAPEVAAAIAAAQSAQAGPPPSMIVNATPLAITASLRPDMRPRNFSRVVSRARENQTRVAQQVAAVVPRTVAPSGPTSGGVARAATLEGAINLHNINLIGVFGTPDARRALVRLDNGRLVRVGVGDRLDGGRVQAIGDSTLNYTVRGRTFQLQMPSG